MVDFHSWVYYPDDNFVWTSTPFISAITVAGIVIVAVIVTIAMLIARKYGTCLCCKPTTPNAHPVIATVEAKPLPISKSTPYS